MNRRQAAIWNFKYYIVVYEKYFWSINDDRRICLMSLNQSKVLKDFHAQR